MRAGLLATIVLLVLIPLPVRPVRASKSATKLTLNPYLYLPQGAKIPDPARDVVFADLEGNGTKEAIIFYLDLGGKFAKPSIMVLEKHASGWEEFWRTSAEGSYFMPPSGVYDLFKIGRPQIVSYISVGASCWGLFDVYQFDPLYDVIRPLDGWPKGSCADHLKITDLNHDGIPEVTFTETNYSTIPHVYWWNGERFVQSDSNFPDSYNQELKRVATLALEPNSPAPLMWGRMAFQIYMLQHRYHGAIDFCQKLIYATGGGNRTTASSSRNEAPEREETDIQEAIFHRWMGQAYKSLSQLAAARTEFEKAQELDLRAKQLDPNHGIPVPLE